MVFSRCYPRKIYIVGFYSIFSLKAGSVIICQAIIMETIGLNIEDRKSTWCEDAENALADGAIETARAIYVHATTVLYLCGSGYVILRKNTGMLRV